MDKDCQEKCKQLIDKYKSYKSKSWRTRTRNQVFEIIHPFILKWMKTILTKWGRFEKEDELLSLSWDCFCFGFDRYNNFEVPIPKFFYDFTRYFLLTHYASEDKVRIHLDDLKETYDNVGLPGDEFIVNMITLFQFREVIPDKFKIIWDDALMSLSDSVKYRKVTQRPGIDRNIYVKLKETYIPIIKLILGIK